MIGYLFDAQTYLRLLDSVIDSNHRMMIYANF